MPYFLIILMSLIMCTLITELLCLASTVVLITELLCLASIVVFPVFFKKKKSTLSEYSSSSPQCFWKIVKSECLHSGELI